MGGGWGGVYYFELCDRQLAKLDNRFSPTIFPRDVKILFDSLYCKRGIYLFFASANRCSHFLLPIFIFALATIVSIDSRSVYQFGLVTAVMRSILLDNLSCVLFSVPVQIISVDVVSPRKFEKKNLLQILVKILLKICNNIFYLLIRF